MMEGSPFQISQGLEFMSYLFQVFMPLFGFIIGAGIFTWAMLAIRTFFHGRD